MQNGTGIPFLIRLDAPKQSSRRGCPVDPLVGTTLFSHPTGQLVWLPFFRSKQHMYQNNVLFTI